MLAGTPPYQAQDTRQLENIIQSKRPPRALPDDCPPPLNAIVAKALAGDLELRYRSAEEFEKICARTWPISPSQRRATASPGSRTPRLIKRKSL